MIRSRLIIGGSEFSDVSKIVIDKSTGDVFNSSDFEIDFDSPYGRHANDFVVGRNSQIFLGSGILDNMIAFYRFSTIGSIIFDEFGIRNGSANGGYSNNSGGFMGFGGAFNGSNGNITIPRLESGTTSFNSSGDFTIAFWARVRDTGSRVGFYDALTDTTNSHPRF